MCVALSVVSLVENTRIAIYPFTSTTNHHVTARHGPSQPCRETRMRKLDFENILGSE